MSEYNKWKLALIRTENLKGPEVFLHQNKKICLSPGVGVRVRLGLRVFLMRWKWKALWYCELRKCRHKSHRCVAFCSFMRKTSLSVRKAKKWCFRLPWKAVSLNQIPGLLHEKATVHCNKAASCWEERLLPKYFFYLWMLGSIDNFKVRVTKEDVTMKCIYVIRVKISHLRNCPSSAFPHCSTPAHVQNTCTGGFRRIKCWTTWSDCFQLKG